MEKDIFLCHTGADKDWVEELAKRLEEESIENRKISVWFDKWDIDGGENLLDKIEEGLKSIPAGWGGAIPRNDSR